MKAKKIWFDSIYIYLETTEDKIGKLPLAWFPRLLNASEEDRNQFELWADNTWIHWEKIGEDLSTEGFFTFKKEDLNIQL